MILYIYIYLFPTFISCLTHYPIKLSNVKMSLNQKSLTLLLFLNGSSDNSSLPLLHQFHPYTPVKLAIYTKTGHQHNGLMVMCLSTDQRCPGLIPGPAKWFQSFLLVPLYIIDLGRWKYRKLMAQLKLRIGVAMSDRKVFKFSEALVSFLRTKTVCMPCWLIECVVFDCHVILTFLYIQQFVWIVIDVEEI